MAKLPSIVIVGRPNVGKSALFNRITGTRRSIVTDEPGITRDRIYGEAEWRGRAFEVVDTGGIVPDEKAGIPGEILRQARVAIEKAAYLVLVVDARAGLTPLDSELAALLRRTGRPLAIAANKVDTARQEADTAPFYEIGAPVFAVSAEHGLGVDNLLDAVTAGFREAVAPASAPSEANVSRRRFDAGGERARDLALEQNQEPQTSRQAEPLVPSTESLVPKEIQIAIIGRPNVGKSTLLNRLVGEERAIVSPEAGTTRDAVDTVIRRHGRSYRVIDTAGIRRKGKTKLVAEKLSVMMARRHLERADVALVLVDASQGVTSSDATIASYAQQAGRAVIIVMNKWDVALKLAAEKSATEAQRHREEGLKGRKVERLKGRKKTQKAELRAQNSTPLRSQSVSRAPASDSHLVPSPQSLAPPDSSLSPITYHLSPNASQFTSQLLADYEMLVRGKLKSLDFAPVVFLSALTGERAGKLWDLIDRAAAAHNRRVPTADLNRWLAQVDLDRASSPGARRVKIFYVTQATTAPPTFVLFTNQSRPLHFSFERYLQNQLRAAFDFTGTPIRFHQRLKKR
ncbi:MAG: ribosome biogenesis GTPase Der [Candidatus Acidiferrales bacterium]